MKKSNEIFVWSMVLAGIGVIAIFLPKVLNTIKENSEDNDSDKPKNDSGDDTSEERPKNKTKEIIAGDTLIAINTANIRKTPEIDNSFPDNIIKENHTGVIGNVVDIKKGEQDGLKWYKCKLLQPIREYIVTYTEAWVREDVVKKI